MALKPLDFDPFAKDEQPARLTELDFDPFASDEPQHKPYDRAAYEAELADFGKGMSRSAKKAEAERQVAAERWEKTPVAASAQAVGQEIYDAALFHLPGAATAAIEGSDVYAERDWKDDLIERSRAQSKARADERKGKDLLPGIDGLGQSLAFSGVGMVAGLGGGLAGAAAGNLVAPVVGAVAGYGVGAATSAEATFRMATNGFVRDLREAADQESVKRTGQPMSDEEFSRKSAELAPLIREYGLWEAVPEAAGNAVGLGILKAGAKDAIGSMFGKNVLTRLTTKMGSLYGTELATETVTQQGQHNVEVGALGEGERRDWTRAADLGASFKEVAPQTILQTTLLAGGTKAGLALHDRIKRGGLTPDQFDALQELNANVEGARIDPEAARMEAIRLLDPSGTIMVPAPAGVREQAAASVEVTPEDESSPIPSELIREGRQAIADVDASKSADEILSRAGMPGVNTRVMVDYGDGRVMAGTVVDAFSEENAELGAAGEGVKIKLDNGRVLSDFFDTLAEAGVRIAPEVAEVASGTQAADVSDTNVGDMTPAKPGQGQMVADERASVTDTTGLASAGAGMAGGITDSMYDMLWTKIEAGDVTEGGEPSTVLQVAKAIRDGGGTISREKLPALANMVSSIKGMGLPNAEYQQAMRNLVASLTPSREESAQTPTDGVIDAPKQAAAVSAPRVFINKVGSDGLTDTERGGPIEKPAISIEPFSDKSIIVRGVGENDGARFAGMTGKPLWNAKAKGWVFSKKREAEVRERLGAAPTSSSASAAPNSPPMDGWARDVADAFKAGGQDAARAKFNEIVDREKLPTGMAAILSDKSKALMKAAGPTVGNAPNVEVIAVTDDRPNTGAAQAMADRAKGREDEAKAAEREALYQRAVKLAEGAGGWVSLPDLETGLGISKGQSLALHSRLRKDGIIDPAKAKKPEAEQAKPTWREIGVNESGDTVVENDSGVRAIRNGGATIIERVGVEPTATGMRAAPANDREDRFKTVEEMVGEFVDDKRSEPPQMPPAKKEAEAESKDGYGTGNKVFTADAAAKARALLRAKMGQLNSGLDPEIVQAGITLAGYHIEAGARSFAAYTKAMVDDLGEAVRPYLRSWYEAVRHYPGFDATGMTPPGEIDAPKGEEKAQDAAQEPEGASDTETLARAFHGAFRDGRTFDTIVQARKFAAEVIGQPVDGQSAMAKVVEEAIEAGIVLRAREIAADARRNRTPFAQVFDQMVALYKAQPILGTRTSTSIEQQAYSTPAPLAYLASRLANVNPSASVYEPTAGNSMLLMEAAPANIIANELNPDRFANLRMILGERATLTNGDATTNTPKPVEVVIANPPFGKVKESNGSNRMFDMAGRATAEIDHAISFKALDAMEDNGRAVLIIGGQKGTAEERKAGYRATAVLAFMAKLYGAYNVVEHFTVDGALYQRQGAGWPVDVIVIEGRGASALPLPGKEVPTVYGSWDELRSRLDGTDSLDTRGKLDGAGYRDGGPVEAADPAGVPVRPGRPHRPNGGARGRVDGAGAAGEVRGGERAAVDQQQDSEGSRGIAGGEQRVAVAEEQQRAGVAGAAEQSDGRPGSRTDSEKRDAGGVPGNAVPRQRVERDNKEAETSFQVQYTPTSNARFSVGTLVPNNMQTAMSNALVKLAEEVGDIDAYVAGKLGYSLDELLGSDTQAGYFSAEQVDALALAIDNVEKGGAFIIGDQTGVGKGRFVAAMLRYALEQNKIPVFVTKDKGLYADMVRDLRDIGMPDIAGRILVSDNGLRGDKALPLSDDVTDTLTSLPDIKHKAAIASIARNGSLPDGYDMLFTTYSQMQYAAGGVEIERQRAVMALAPNAIVVLDESHEAGGTEGKKIDPKTGQEIPSRADFVRDVLRESSGAVYSSATYAKNPHVMSLYFKTDLAMAVDNIDQLAATIASGGVPLQQVVANMLVESGQYARRERSYEGVEMAMDVLPTNDRMARQASHALRQVFTLDTDYMESVRASFIEEMEGNGDKGAKDGAVGNTSASGTGFAQVMHVVVSQMLLSLKAKATVDKAIALHQAGEKPIIALSNTNESIIRDYVEEAGLNVGDSADLTFNAILGRYLRRLRRITLKNPNGDLRRIYLSDDDIRTHGGQDALDQYRAVEKFIEGTDLSELPASPVDYILDRLNAAGVKADEITGRQQIIRNGRYTQRKASAAEKKKAMNAYNSGKLDALVINKSGSTGFSMHATDKKGNDGKKRHMILLQPDPNIDVFMQMLGRIHRTGQIKLPGYTLGISDLAVEKRLAAVLMRKMASLNANTTASKKSAVSLDNVTDFMNKYGDEVVAEYLRENPEIANLTDVRPGLSIDGLSAKFTGRLAILEPEQVSAIYEQIESAYSEYIASLDSMGMNTLEAKTLDLDARTTSEEVLVNGKDDDSPFGAAAMVETVNVRKTGKPYTLDEVKDEARKVLDGKTSAQFVDDQVAAIDALVPAYRAKMEEARDRAQVAFDEARTDKQRDRASEARANWVSNIADLESKVEKIEEALRDYAPGKLHVLVVKDGEAESRVHAIALGVDIKKVKDNPAAASAYKVRFAIADAGREVRVPLSKLLDGGSYSTERANLDDVTEAFENGGQEARETRQIITGNLVAGYAVFKKGQITMFTDSEGRVRQGILMPREFDTAAELERRPVELTTATQVSAFLTALSASGYRQNRMVKTSDGVVGITHNGYEFSIAVNTKGGKPYFLNKQVRDLIGDFQKRNGQKVLRANVANVATLERVMAIYRENLDAKFVVTADKDAARAIVAAASPASQGGEKFRMDAVLAANKVDEMEPALRARFDALGLSDKVTLNVVSVVRSMLTGKAHANAAGLYAQKVIQVAAGGSNPMMTLNHEAIHALRDMKVLRGLDWKALEKMARADNALMAEVNDRWGHLNLSQEALMEEAVAELFATWATGRAPKGFAGRAFERVAAFFKALRAALKDTGLIDALAEGANAYRATRTMQRIDSGTMARGKGGRFIGKDAEKFDLGRKDAKTQDDGAGRNRPPANVAFDDDASERRWQDARKGVGGAGSLRERVTAWLEHLGHGFTRHYIELPNISRYADVHEQLRKLEAAPQASKEQVVRFLRDITNGMSAADLDLFTRKVVLDDLAYEVTQEHALPFGLTPGTLEAELVKVDIALAARPDLEAKVRQRQLFTRKVANMLVEAGVLHKDSVKNPAYYRHQVLDYARAQVAYAKGAGKKVKTPHWASRHGSELDINANLLEAEFDWLHKALTDISAAKTIAWIKRSEHNIRSSIVKQARDQNAALVQQALDQDLKDNGYTDEKGRDTSPMNEQWKAFKKSIAMGLDSVGKAVKSGKIGPIPAEFSAVAESLADKDAEGDGDKLFPFLSWLLDNDKPGAMGAAQAFKAIVGRKAWVKGLLGEKYTDTTNMELVVKRFAPEGYTTWQPDEGKLLYTAKTLPEHVIDRLMRKLSAAGADAMATADVIAALDSVRPLLAVGGVKYQMVIPIELAATLNSLRDEQADSLLGHLTQKPLSMWKQWTLMSPRRWLTYNINNTSGDIDAVIAGNPSALKRAKEAAKEIYAVMVKKEKPSARYLEAVERGVFDSGISLQEIPDINSLSEFQALINPTNFKSPVDVTKFAMRKGWGFLRGSTTLRENVMRYALYLDYVERLEAGESMDKIGYGATKPAIVDAVKDIKDRAALLARDTIGDYGNVSHYGRWLRTNLMPFYSWMEVNTKRYWRLTGNAASQGIGKGVATGGALAVMAGTRTTGSLALRMVALYGLVSLWNHLVFGDDEDDLSEAERIGLHINLGRDADGNIRTLRFNGAFSDFLGWIGFDDAARAFVNIESGRADWSDVMKAAAKGAPNKVVLGVRPDLKLAVEGLAGVRFFPDIFNPRPLRDGWRNALQAVGLENEYDFALDRPSKGYVQSWFKGPLKAHDAGELAYSRIRGLAGDWMREQNGAAGVSTIETPRSNALHDYKLARKYGDVAAAKSARERLKELGVTGKELAASIKRAHPLGAVPLHDRGAFLRSLSAGERESLSRAVEWYRSTYLSPLSE